jgi:hypothetical protein
MPAFDTAGPVTVAIDLPAGDVRIAATDRADTTVEVTPSDPGRDADVQAARETRVEHLGGDIVIRAPKPRGLRMIGRPGFVDITVGLPAGSRLRVEASAAAVHATGRLDDCRITTGAGEVELEETGPLYVSTGIGAVLVTKVTGRAETRTGSGRIRLAELDGPAVVKDSNGSIWVGRVTGELRATTDNGEVIVDQPGAGVTASTANGDVRIGALTRGTADLKTSLGEVEIGIRSGTAVRLDVSTDFGRVRNELDEASGPAPADEVAEVRARTRYGDIVIRRAAADAAGTPVGAQDEEA